MPPSGRDQHALTVGEFGEHHLVELLEGGHAHLDIDTVVKEAVNACTYQVSNIDTDMTDWFSSDASIAAVSPEEVQGVSIGTATAFAEGTVEVWGGVCGCHWEPIEPSAPVYVKPTLSVAGNQYDSIFVGTDPNLSAANTILASASPAGGTFTEASSVSSDAFTPVKSGGPGWVVTTTEQSSAVGDRKLTFTYTSDSQKTTQSLNVTARQFAYATNNSPSNTCTLGYGTQYLVTYTPFTHPDKAAVQPGIGVTNTAVTESFNPQPPAGTITGSGILDANSQFADRLTYCSTSPLTLSTSVTQTVSIEGYQVRQNQLTYSSSGVSLTNQGPTQ